MDDYFEKRFSSLLNGVRKRGTKFNYFPRRGNVEVIYHFFSSFFHFFLSSLKRLENACRSGADNSILFQQVTHEQSITPFLAYRLLIIHTP